MHPEVLRPKQEAIFRRLPEFPDFYLVGGTALALQIGHRISLDFDLFSPRRIPTTLFEKIEKVFLNSKIRILINHSEQVSVLIDGIKVDFVYYKFPTFLPLPVFKRVRMFSIPEIAATKAYVLGRRPLFRDYIDLYFILMEGRVTLVRIIELAQQKYGEEFDPRLFLEQLIFLEDVQDTKIQFLRKKISRKKLEQFLQNQVKKIKL